VRDRRVRSPETVATLRDGLEVTFGAGRCGRRFGRAAEDAAFGVGAAVDSAVPAVEGVVGFSGVDVVGVGVVRVARVLRVDFSVVGVSAGFFDVDLVAAVVAAVDFFPAAFADLAFVDVAREVADFFAVVFLAVDVAGAGCVASPAAASSARVTGSAPRSGVDRRRARSPEARSAPAASAPRRAISDRSPHRGLAARPGWRFRRPR
jgi:hypothetical protein